MAPVGRDGGAGSGGRGEGAASLRAVGLRCPRETPRWQARVPGPRGRLAPRGLAVPRAKRLSGRVRGLKGSPGHTLRRSPATRGSLRRRAAWPRGASCPGCQKLGAAIIQRSPSGREDAHRSATGAVGDERYPPARRSRIADKLALNDVSLSGLLRHHHDGVVPVCSAQIPAEDRRSPDDLIEGRSESLRFADRVAPDDLHLASGSAKRR